MNAYPEMICIDATYRLLSIRAPVYIILVEDGCGESEIVAVGILIKEDKANLKWMLSKFKKINEHATEIRNVMADKDWTERDVLQECFPDAKILICIFHVFKIFNREITTEKMRITSSQRNLALTLLQNMVYASTQIEFDIIKLRIENELPKTVTQYLKNNWFGISEEWCPRLGCKILNFMNTTNNRVENINAKLKSVISLHSSLEEFFENLFIIIKSLEKEKRSRLAHNINKRTLHNFLVGSAEHKYSKLVSEYALKQMINQLRCINKVKLELSENGDFFKVATDSSYQTTSDSCNCLFAKSIGLPCKHIFAVRRYLKEDLYNEKLVNRRWTLAHISEQSSLELQSFSKNSQVTLCNYPVGSAEHRYSELVSEDALKHVITQIKYMNDVKFELSENGDFFKGTTDISYQTTSDSCDCFFSKSMGLPCKHIFAVRQHLKEDLYNERLVHRRWTLTYILEHQNFFQNSRGQESTESNINPTITVEAVPDQATKVLSQQEKYRCALSKAKCIAHLAAECSTKDFNKIISAMDKFIYILEENKHDIEVTCDGKLQSHNITKMQTDREIGCSMNFLCIFIFRKGTN